MGLLEILLVILLIAWAFGGSFVSNPGLLNILVVIVLVYVIYNLPRRNI